MKILSALGKVASLVPGHRAFLSVVKSGHLFYTTVDTVLHTR